MLVHEPGSVVFLGGVVEARVEVVHLLPGGHVEYGVGYWSDGERTRLTVPAWDVAARDGDRLTRVGFGPPATVD